jgi:hypothetical protein
MGMMSNSRKMRLAFRRLDSMVAHLSVGSRSMQPWFAGLLASVRRSFSDLAPMGYQDETGFHFGSAIWAEAEDAD